jgi:hypothetical protein
MPNYKRALKLVPQPAPSATSKPRPKARAPKAPKLPPPTITKEDFLRWETATEDTIDFKKIYVDMAGGDLPAGVALSQIVYWHLPSKKGDSKMRVSKAGHEWIAKRRAEWWTECRLKEKRLDRALVILSKRSLKAKAHPSQPSVDLIEKRSFKFNGEPTVHVRIKWPEFLASLQHHLSLLALTEGNLEIDEKGKTNLPIGKKRIHLLRNKLIPQKVNSTNKDSASKNTKKTTTSQASLDVVDQELTLRLIEAGVAPYRAKQLTADHAPEMLRRLQFLPHIPNVQNAGGLLAARPSDPWSEPTSLKKAGAAKRQATKRQADEAAAAKKKLDAENARIAEEQQNDQLDAWIKNLPADEFEELEKEATDKLKRLAHAGVVGAGALAAARRNVARKWLNLPTEDLNDD